MILVVYEDVCFHSKLFVTAQPGPRVCDVCVFFKLITDRASTITQLQQKKARLPERYVRGFAGQGEKKKKKRT